MPFPARVLSASCTSYDHPKAPVLACILLLCSLALLRASLWVDGKSGDNLQDVIPQPARGNDLRVPLDLPITRMTYSGQSKIRLFRQTTENWKTDQWKQRWFISNNFIRCSDWRLNNAFKLRAGSLCCTKAIFKSMFPLSSGHGPLSGKKVFTFFVKTSAALGFA